MSSEVKKLPFLLPMIGAAIAMTFFIVEANINTIHFIIAGWTPFTNTDWWLAMAGNAFGVIFAGVLIALSILGWILQAILPEKTDFQHIPLIFGIIILALSALGVTLGIPMSFGNFLPVATYPQYIGWFVVKFLLILIGSCGAILGVIGGIFLIKY